MKQYSPEVSKLFTIGKSEGNWLAENWPSYPEKYDLTEDHIPELMDIVENCYDIYDVEFTGQKEYQGFPVEQASWAPQHAWRALGQLKFEPAIELLLKIIRMDEMFDYLRDEIPSVMSLLGEPAIPMAVSLLKERSKYESIEIMGVEALKRIAKIHPDLRDRCVQELVTCLKQHEKNGESLNGMVVLSLKDLEAKEALPEIEQAFAANTVDEMVMGDWFEVQHEFGVISMLEMKQLQQERKKEKHKPVQLKFSTSALSPKSKDKGFGSAVGSSPKTKKTKKKF